MQNEVVMGIFTGGLGMLFFVIFVMLYAAHLQRKEDRIRTLEDKVWKLEQSVRGLETHK